MRSNRSRKAATAAARICGGILKRCSQLNTRVLCPFRRYNQVPATRVFSWLDRCAERVDGVNVQIEYSRLVVMILMPPLISPFRSVKT